MFVDAHCHIDRFPDLTGVLANAEAANVVIVAVTETPSDFQLLISQLGPRRLVRVALGLHPMRAAHLSPFELSQFNRYITRADYVGEVGLDGSQHGRATLKAQLRVFEHVLGHPDIATKVLTVHSRGAEAETVELLGQARARAILHWYSGATKHLDAALAAGLFFSINPAMMRSRKGQGIVAALPRNRVLTETDGPYTKLGSRACTPSDVRAVVKELAPRWSLTPAEAAQQVYENMATLRRRAYLSASNEVHTPALDE